MARRSVLLPYPDKADLAALLAWGQRLIQALKSELDVLVLSTPQTGDVRVSVAAVVPSGWILANGAVLAQADYAALAQFLGTRFATGGEGAGNFRLPNLPAEATGAVWIIKK